MKFAGGPLRVKKVVRGFWGEGERGGVSGWRSERTKSCGASEAEDEEGNNECNNEKQMTK